jgi:hypothetical protein
MRTTDDMAYAELHRPVPKVVIEPLGNPSRDNAWGLTLWLVAGLITLALLFVGSLGMMGVV